MPSLCPKSLGYGRLEGDGGGWLVTDFLEMQSGGASKGMSLAEKLGKLHSTPAPVPEGIEKSVFGFPLPTCCGSTVQENGWCESWAEFYGERR